MFAPIDPKQVKWGYATHAYSAGDPAKLLAHGILDINGEPPRQDDLLIAEVVEIRQHVKIELPSARPSTLFEGDLVGVSWGHRYATRQYHGRIPDTADICHLLSVAGVCGEVIGKSTSMEEPTILRPIGYVNDGRGQRVNLRDHGLTPRTRPGPAPTVVLVVGSTMDSGKTTVASSIVNGLAKSGAKVCAGKLTGTGSAKDLMLMKDAGAVRVLDFTDIGHASTAECARQDLANITTAIISNLSIVIPDYIVLEIADGVVQRETEMLLQMLSAQHTVDYVFYCCSDTLGVMSGLEILGRYALNVVAVSGLVCYTALSAGEARRFTDLPVLLVEDLRSAQIATLLPKRAAEPASLADVG